MDSTLGFGPAFYRLDWRDRRLEQAEALFRRALELHGKSSKTDNLETAGFLRRLGELQLGQRKLAEAEKRSVPILLHPACPVTYAATKGYEMAAGLGLMFDTTIALARLILSGVLEQHPGLKLVCPHVGGALPYLVGRVDHQTMVLKRGADHIKRAPSEYLKQVYLDTVSPIALAIRYGYDYVGPGRLLYSSDHPWVDPNLIAGHVKSLKLPAADEAAVFAGNARKLFGLRK